MSSNDDPEKDEDKKVTAAITDAPQEEFIAQSNVPSRTENPDTPEDKAGEEPLKQKD